MRPIHVLSILALIAAPLFAHEHDHGLSPEEIQALLISASHHQPVANAAAPIVTDGLLPAPESAKAFNITAKQFTFTPSSFTVNVGDTVTLNISVPSNDGSSVGHGFIMDTWVEPGFTIARGATKSVTFTPTAPGTYGFVCTQSSCGSGHSSMIGSMTVIAAPSPAITNFAPSSGPTTGGTTVTISGSNFVSGATVTFDTNAATNVNVVSDTSITAVSPAHAAGAVNITVTNPDGKSASSGSFTYITPAPAVTSISPATGPTSGGTAVTIAGSGFENGATVTISGVSLLNVNVVSPTQITATTPVGPASEELIGDVVVHNPDGTSATKTGAFAWSVPPLTVSAVAPGVGAPAGGTQVIITGAGFTTAIASSVTFGGVPATNVRILDAVTIAVTAPAHPLGTVDVVVQIGSNTAKGTFTYATAPPRRRAARH